MPQIVNLPNFGGQLGSGLGQGLGEGLMFLAQRKLDNMAEQKKQQQGSKFWQSLGISPEIASGLASAPENVQKSFLDRLEGIGVGGQQQSPQQQMMEQQAAPVLQQQRQMEQASSQQPSSPQLNMQTGQPSLQDVLSGLSSGQPIAQHQLLNQQQKQINPLLQNVLQQQALKEAVPMEKEEPRRLSSLTGEPTQVQRVPQQQVQAQQKGGLTLGATPTERRHREMLDLKREAAEKKEISEKYKLSKETRKEIVQKAQAARQDLKDLNRLEDLEKEGKLDTPGYVEFLKRSGLDIPALMEPGSEEFQKVAATFMRNASTYLGGRVSNYELEQFLKTIPSLSQSPDGRKRVISNLKYITRSALEYNDAMKEVIAENKGIPPYDLDEQIDTKVEKRLDKLANQFKKDLERPVPKAQNKMVTALQASLGSAIGTMAPVVAKAGAGAAIGGAFGGPVGAGIGGATGALAHLLNR